MRVIKIKDFVNYMIVVLPLVLFDSNVKSNDNVLDKIGPADLNRQ